MSPARDIWSETPADDITIEYGSPNDRAGWRYPFDPHPKQRLASSYMVDEILMGGAAGPGKTDWMLAELVNLSLAIPDVKTLLLRNTYGELQEEIIPRLESRIPSWVGKYSAKLRSFVFYNHARLRLGYLERESHQQRYVGAEYAAIGFDELTLLPWASYQFLASRARATGRIAAHLKHLGLRPRRMATSNPGGPAHTPVKEHFVDVAPPNRIYRDPVTGLTRVYVPATVDDNPSMPPQYRRLLESLPPEKRKALLEGSWDILEGARFSQWNRTRHVVSFTEFPSSLLSGERTIAVDYGFGAPFAAVWLCKLGNGLTVVYREAYATEMTAIQQAEMIKSMTTPEEWEQGVTVIMDPAMWGRRDASAPKSQNPLAPPVSSPAHDYQTVLGVTPRKANNDRLTGWARLDEKLRVHPDGWPRLLVYDTCLDLIRTLPALERSKTRPEDVGQTPKQEDHLCHPAGTLISTARGEVAIENIRPGDLALTRHGYRRIVAWAMTDPEATVGEIRLSNGHLIRSTGNHPYWTENRGWVRADEIRPCDVLRYRMNPWEAHAKNPSCTTGTPTPAGPTPPTGPTVSTTGAAEARATSTATSTPTITRLSPMASSSTTATTTPSITTPPTSASSTSQDTPPTTLLPASPIPPNWNRLAITSNPSGNEQQIGTARRKAGPGTANTASASGKTGNTPNALASNAVTPTKPAPSGKPLNTALTGAEPQPAAHQGWMTRTVPAGGAVLRSGSTNTRSLVGAPVHAVAAWSPVSAEPVYTMTVEEVHEFVADGVLASNCDALRYGLMYLEGKSPVVTGEDDRRPSPGTLTGGLATKKW